MVDTDAVSFAASELSARARTVAHQEVATHPRYSMRTAARNGGCTGARTPGTVAG